MDIWSILIFSTRLEARRLLYIYLISGTWTCGEKSIVAQHWIDFPFDLIDLIMPFNWNTIPIPACVRQMSCKLHILCILSIKWLQYSHSSRASRWQEELLHRIQRHGPGGDGGGVQGHPRQGLRGRGARGEQCSAVPREKTSLLLDLFAEYLY